MKILFFIRSLDVGGSQRQLTLLARSLSERGHDVAVAVLYPGYPMEAAIENTGVRLLTIDKLGRWDVAGPLVRLCRLFIKERPDVLYCLLPVQTTLAALLLPPWLKTRLVFGIRASEMELGRYDFLSGLAYRLEAWCSRRADLVITNARASRTDAIARGFPADRIAVIPNGIDTDAMRPDPDAGRDQRLAWGIRDEDFVVGMVARLDPMKDHPTFLRAAAEFASKHPDARFVCVGGGAQPYRRKLEAMSCSHGLEQHVIWTGEAKVTRAIYNAFDIATLSSAFGEGFSNVIGEAMACGVPVVSTDVGDAALIIGNSGKVVPPLRHELLCAAWSGVRHQLDEGYDFGPSLRHRIVQNYDPEIIVQRTEDVLMDLSSGCVAASIAARNA